MNATDEKILALAEHVLTELDLSDIKVGSISRIEFGCNWVEVDHLDAIRSRFVTTRVGSGALFPKENR